MSAAVSTEPCETMLNFRVPDSLADALDELVRRIGTTRSALIREAVSRLVAEQDVGGRGSPPTP